MVPFLAPVHSTDFISAITHSLLPITRGRNPSTGTEGKSSFVTFSSFSASAWLEILGTERSLLRLEKFRKRYSRRSGPAVRAGASLGTLAK
jgi:hypothetical protein